jgi:hypothetical protein
MAQKILTIFNLPVVEPAGWSRWPGNLIRVRTGFQSRAACHQSGEKCLDLAGSVNPNQSARLDGETKVSADTSTLFGLPFWPQTQAF